MLHFITLSLLILWDARTDGQSGTSRRTSPFGQALEAALKGWGYAVVTDQKTDSGGVVSLAYMIMPYDGQVLARLSTSTVELGRAYTVTTSGATPASALSLMRRG